MRYYDTKMITQVFIVSVMMGWTLRELCRVAKGLLKVMYELFEIQRLQKSKKPARSLATQRISKTHCKG